MPDPRNEPSGPSQQPSDEDLFGRQTASFAKPDGSTESVPGPGRPRPIPTPQRPIPGVTGGVHHDAPTNPPGAGGSMAENVFESPDEDDPSHGLTLPQARPSGGDSRPIPFLQIPQPGTGGPAAAPPRTNDLRRATQAPQFLGQYEIVSELGRGGMGIVYKGMQRGLNRPVGLKVLPEHLSTNPDLVARFKVEARAAARLNHPNIGQIYEIGEDQGTHFFAMEYISGKTLAQLVSAQRQVPFLEAAQYVAQSADALAYAHRNGVVHRDIKPSNIMLTDDGHIKVMDFGLARIEGDERLTMSGMTLGTPAYMSPEQAGSESAGPLDQRSDIYSLGVVLYEMLTGRLPFEGKSKIEILRKIVDVEPLPPHVFRERVPPALERIVLKAMAKRVGERYATAVEMRDDLKSLQLTSATTSIGTGDASEAAVAPSAGSMARLLAAAFALAVVAGIAIYAIATNKDKTAAVSHGPATAAPTAAPTEGAPVAELDAVAWKRLVESGRLDEAEAQLAAYLEAAPAGDAAGLDARHRIMQAWRAEAAQRLEAGRLDEAADAWMRGVELDGDDVRETLSRLAPDLLATEPGSAPWGKDRPGALLARAIERATTSDLAQLHDLARLHAGSAADQTAHLAMVVAEAARVARTGHRSAEEVACLLALGENAATPRHLEAVTRRIGTVILAEKWNATALGMAAQALRGAVPLPPPGQAPAARWLHLAAAAFAAQAPTTELSDAERTAAIEGFVQSVTELHSTSTTEGAGPLVERWRAQTPATGPLSPSPSSVPKDRLTRLEGATAATTAEAGWGLGLEGISSTAWPLAKAAAADPALPVPPRLANVMEGTITVGDGNGDRRRAVVYSDGREYILIADFDGDDSLQGEWPVSRRYPLHPAVVVRGKFGVAMRMAFVFNVDLERRLAMLANVGWLEGSLPAVALEGVPDPAWRFRLQDVDGDGLLSDFATEARTVGARGSVGPSGTELPLFPDVPFRLGNGWLALGDLTSIGSEVYWSVRGVASCTFTVDLAEANETTPAPRLIVTTGEGPQPVPLVRQTPFPIELPLGIVDTIVAAPGYMPVRYIGPVGELAKGPVALTLAPFDATQVRTITVPMKEIAAGTVVSVLQGGAGAPVAMGTPGELALRRAPSGEVEVAMTLPASNLTNSQGPIAVSGLFVPPTSLLFAPLATELPAQLTPMNGALGYRANLVFRAEGEALIIEATLELMP